MLPVWIFPLIGIAALGRAIHANRRRAGDPRRAAAAATAAGFDLELDAGAPPATLRHELFDDGRDRKIPLRMTRPGSSDAVFLYTFVTGDGKNRKDHRHACALVKVPFAAPRTTIGPEHAFRGVARSFGYGDIEIESNEFNDRYAVKSDDASFAVTPARPRGEGDLTRRRGEVEGAWATVESELQRRHELVPPLVESVRNAAAREQSLFDAAVAAVGRAAATESGDTAAATKAEAAVDEAVGAVVALRQRYPELDSQRNFLALQSALTDTEDRIAAARRYYNTAARDFNNACHDLRGRAIARRAGFVDAEYFQA